MKWMSSSKCHMQTKKYRGCNVRQNVVFITRGTWRITEVSVTASSSRRKGNRRWGNTTYVVNEKWKKIECWEGGWRNMHTNNKNKRKRNKKKVVGGGIGRIWHVTDTQVRYFDNFPIRQLIRRSQMFVQIKLACKLAAPLLSSLHLRFSPPPHTHTYTSFLSPLFLFALSTLQHHHHLTRFPVLLSPSLTWSIFSPSLSLSLSLSLS